MVEAEVDDARSCLSGYAAQEWRAGDFVAAGDAEAGGIEWHDVLLMMIVRCRAPGKCSVAFCVTLLFVARAGRVYNHEPERTLA
jgi:hypothetical protein